MIFVLDASAMLAYLKQELGWEQVAQFLADTANQCHAHAVNLYEVFLHFARTSTRAAAETAISDLVQAGVRIREDIDAEFWEEAADHVAQAHRERRSLSLADAWGLTLTRRLGAEFVTTDHTEFDPIQQQGICRVRFVR